MVAPLAPATNTLRRTNTRIDFSSKVLIPSETLPKKKKATSPLNQTKRKPTLIRNLGGVGASKGRFIEAAKKCMLIAFQSLVT